MIFISQKELKVYLMFVGIITLLALLIVILIFLPDYIRYYREKTEENEIVREDVDMSRFKIPDSHKTLFETRYIPFVEDKGEWTAEDSKPYWQDTELLILEYLEKENERYINELFKDIP
jgi:hypothetical protein